MKQQYLLFMFTSICLFLKTTTYAESTKERKKPNLCFPVVGDIGGIPMHPFQTQSQRRVANLLAEVVKKNDCQFIVGLGDNFYFDGVKNVDDPRFYWTYEQAYSSPSLVVPWYMIAGNHDHKSNVSAQIAYTKVSKRWNFPDFYYTKVFNIPNTKKSLQLVMLDTTMLCFYKKKSNAPPPDQQWAWIEKTLKDSKSEYLVVAGHHPIYSSSSHGNTGCLVDRLKPLLEKFSVTAYFSGHDHNLQHIKEPESSVHYFVSGSGNFVDRRFNNKINLPAQSSSRRISQNGFMLVQLKLNKMKIQAYHIGDFMPVKMSRPLRKRENICFNKLN